MALKDGLVKLKAFAAAPWFPVLVGFLSGANLFLLVMSAPLVILYCSAVLANPKRFLKQIQLEQVLGVVERWSVCLKIFCESRSFVRFSLDWQNWCVFS